MSLYAEYIQERLGKHIVESDRGFATYFFIPEGVYLEDIFVHSDFRQSGEASKMADQIAAIAKEKGLKKMFGSIKPTSNHSTSSLKVLIAYGFQLHSAHEDAIIMVKELG